MPFKLVSWELVGWNVDIPVRFKIFGADSDILLRGLELLLELLL